MKNSIEELIEKSKNLSKEDAIVAAEIVQNFNYAQKARLLKELNTNTAQITFTDTLIRELHKRQ